MSLKMNWERPMGDLSSKYGLNSIKKSSQGSDRIHRDARGSACPPRIVP
jgi:hypothetical protein